MRRVAASAVRERGGVGSRSSGGAPVAGTRLRRRRCARSGDCSGLSVSFDLGPKALAPTGCRSHVGHVQRVAPAHGEGGGSGSGLAFAPEDCSGERHAAVLFNFRGSNRVEAPPPWVWAPAARRVVADLLHDRARPCSFGVELSPMQ